MARVIAALMRHGVYEQPPGTPSAHLPHPLKPKGWQQASESAVRLAEICKREGWALDPVIDSSPLLRAWQTASVAADEFKKIFGREYALEQFEALMERSVGAAANLDLEQIAAAVDADPRLDALPEDWKQQSHFKLPLHGAESLMESGARVREHLLARCAPLQSRGEDTLKLFVGHGGCFRHAAVQLGALPLGDARKLSLHHGGFVLIEEADDQSWKKIGGEWKQRSAEDIAMRKESA
jgi:2,3-bisphosphoglycerate-dependent phosphoglycerate mutase